MIVNYEYNIAERQHAFVCIHNGKASYQFLKPDIGEIYAYPALVNWFNKCCEETYETSKE